MAGAYPACRASGGRPASIDGRCYRAPMVFQYWHLAVVAAFAALVVVGWRARRQPTLVILAALSLAVSGFLLWTLVLEEPFESDLNAKLDSVALIGVPAVLGVGLGVLAWRRASSSGARRAG